MAFHQNAAPGATKPPPSARRFSTPLPPPRVIFPRPAEGSAGERSADDRGAEGEQSKAKQRANVTEKRIDARISERATREEGFRPVGPPQALGVTEMRRPGRGQVGVWPWVDGWVGGGVGGGVRSRRGGVWPRREPRGPRGGHLLRTRALGGVNGWPRRASNRAPSRGTGPRAVQAESPAILNRTKGVCAVHRMRRRPIAFRGTAPRAGTCGAMSLGHRASCTGRSTARAVPPR